MIWWLVYALYWPVDLIVWLFLRMRREQLRRGWLRAAAEAVR